jgi:hypothetical protein
MKHFIALLEKVEKIEKRSAKIKIILEKIKKNKKGE